MKKISRKLCSIILLLSILSFGLTSLTSCSNDGYDPQSAKADEKISAVVNDKEFKNAGEEKQIKEIQQTLEELEEGGYIAEDTIVYDGKYKVFSYQLSDGSFRGVSLQEFGDTYNGESSSTSESSEVSVKTTNEINVDDGSTAIVLNAFENTPYRRNYYEDLEDEWDSAGLETDVDVDVTVDDLKNLGEYDVIVFAMHGSMYNDAPVLCINQEVTQSTNAAYKTELQNQSIVNVLYKDGTRHYWILPQFFAYQYSENELECDIIFSESCMFYGDDSVDTEPMYSFGRIFDKITDCAIIGYHNSVLADYSRNVMKATINNALNGKTAAISLKIAMETYGKTDECTEKSHGKYMAYPVFFGDDSARLVEIPVADFSIPENKVITLGEIDVIEPELTPDDACDYSIKWSSSDESVATVSPSGEVGIITALSKGTATIIAEITSGGKTITKTTDLRVASKARDVVLVLDVSGSMYGEALNEMKESAIQFCNDILKDEYNNRVGIVFYDDSISAIDLTDDLDMLISRIQSAGGGGGTDMEAGLSAADEMLKKSSKAESIKNVVIMADGLPNRGNTSYSGSMPSQHHSGFSTDVSYANAVIDTAKQMMNNYNLYSLGFFHSLYSDDKDFATVLMKELTNKTDGYYQVDKAEDLQFAFGDISEEIRVGSKIVINIACPVAVRVSYGGEMLSTFDSEFCNVTSFGTLHLLGKKKDIKVVSLDSNKKYEVELVGTGEGKMDYSINYFDEKEQLSDYRSFEAVPINLGTVIKSNTDNSVGDIVLNIDEDGDGEIDIIWTALAKSRGKITYEKAPIKPEEPKKEEPTVEEKENMPTWVIILICVVAFILIGGVIMVIVISAKKTDSNVDADSEFEISRPTPLNMVKCSRCGMTHSSDKPCECWNKNNNEQVTEEAERRTGFIQVTNGSMNGFSIPIKDRETLYIGKDPKIANLVFTGDYKNVSRMHCAITFDAKTNRYFVTDSSTNGTYLINKKRLIKGKRTPVSANTILILANDECTILLG